jgi:hypothetical protein
MLDRSDTKGCVVGPYKEHDKAYKSGKQNTMGSG